MKYKNFNIYGHPAEGPMLKDFQKNYAIMVSKYQIKLTDSKLFRRYMAWFRSSVPESLLDWLTDSGNHNLIVRLGENPYALTLFQSKQKSKDLDVITRISSEKLTPEYVSKKIRSLQIDRTTKKTILEIEKKNFFIRNFTIPKSAKEHLNQISASEIERKTPFKLTEILTAYQIDRNYLDKTKIQVCQLIIRKDILISLLEKIGLIIEDIDFLRVVIEQNDSSQFPEIPLGKKNASPKMFNLILQVIFSAAIILMIIGVIMLFFKQERTANDLTEKILSLSSKAAKVRETADHATSEGRLLLAVRKEKRTKYLLVDIIAEVTKLLPDGSYITELRLSESQTGEQILDIIGFSDSALKLPALFDKASIFTDASLTAPIMTDTNEKKDSFSLQAKLKPIKAK